MVRKHHKTSRRRVTGIDKGRKRDKQNKANVEVRQTVTSAVMTPLEVMTAVMREFITAVEKMGPQEYIRVDQKFITRLTLLDRAVDVAKEAAPYLHPRFS
jgi:hypothetical protein